MTARDELAALIWRWMSDNNDDYVENPDDPDIYATDVRIDATLNLVELADAILAAGWVPKSVVVKALDKMSYGGYDPTDEGMARAARLVATLRHVSADENGPSGWICDGGMAVPDE